MDNTGGDVAAVADSDASLVGPAPDVRAARPAGRGPLWPVPLSSAGLPGVFDVGVSCRLKAVAFLAIRSIS
jgi:hypothetical protein